MRKRAQPQSLETVEALIEQALRTVDRWRGEAVDMNDDLTIGAQVTIQALNKAGAIVRHLQRAGAR